MVDGTRNELNSLDKEISKLPDIKVKLVTFPFS